ncbi:MAG: metallophosphoesterase [Bacteroidetes bacterium]|nr:metallophosphoesterase [Bacteroidota bacterium]
MNSKPPFFLLQAAFVLLTCGFHILLARHIYMKVAGHSPRLRIGLLAALAGAVVFLDLPLAHSFIIYRFFHPTWIDRLMHQWIAPFMTIHFNVAFFGGVFLFGRYVLGPLSRVTGRLYRRIVRGESSGVNPAASIVRPHAQPLAIGGHPQILTPHMARRRFLTTAGMAVAGYAAGATTLSAMNSTDDYRLEQVVVKMPNLPQALKGTTIALITDIHSSVFMMRDEMERYVKALNAMNADIAIVGGDFVNSKLGEVYPFAEAFSALRAPLGVYGVTGNHDYYTGEVEKVAHEVEQCGIKLIRNSNLAIEKNGEKIWLMGMDDADIYDVKPYLETGKSPRGTIENMLRGVPDGAPRLFLCHKPYPFEEYSTLGMDLMLSGHTHGGQVVIAQMDNINLSFATLASRYVAGLYRARSNRRSQLYVSRGVGTVGLPMRLNCPPEVTRIVLV